MELKDAIQGLVQNSMKAAQLTDLRIGTVTSASPLEITIDPAMAPLQAGVLYLTEAVVEKKIPVLEHQHITSGFQHTHQISTLGHTHTVSGVTSSRDLTESYGTQSSLNQDDYTSDNRLLTSEIICYEHGQALPVRNGYIILNRGLETGDKVLLLRVQSGQKFIVLSRVFEG